MDHFWIEVGWGLARVRLSKLPGALSMRLHQWIYPDGKMIEDFQVDALREGLRLTNNSGVPMAVVALKLTNKSPYLAFEFDSIHLNVERVISVTLHKHTRIERGHNADIRQHFPLSSEQSAYLPGN